MQIKWFLGREEGRDGDRWENREKKKGVRNKN
jgi:hypothetical protein